MTKFAFKFHWSFFVLGLLMFYLGSGVLFCCYVLTAILHEMGHAFAARLLGYKLNIIRLMPYGASLSGNNYPFKQKDEITIALCGPLVNIALIILMLALWWCFPLLYTLTQDFFYSNVSLLIYNLLPIYPLDGGRVLFALFSKKRPRAKAFKITRIIGFILTILIFVLFFLSMFTNLNYSLGINAVFLLIGLFTDDKSSYYINLKDIEPKHDLLKKGLLLKTIAIDENSTLYDAYKLLDKNNINQIFIMDENYKVIDKIMESELEKLLYSKPLDTRLVDVIK